MRRTLLHIVLALSASVASLFASSQPSTGSSYVRTRVPRAGSANVLPPSMCAVTVDYVDGLGRARCRVTVGSGTGSADMATWTDYDLQGRRCREYLPVNTGAGSGASPSASFPSLAASYHGDGCPYTSIRYDALGRVSETTGPGAAWRGDTVPHSVRHTYRLNRDDFEPQWTTYSLRCRRYHLSGDTALAVDGSYPAATLRVDVCEDEDGNRSATFTDKLGRRVLLRRYDSSGRFHFDTYWVYDVCGRVRYVVTPEGSFEQDSIASSVLSRDFTARWCYAYRYDERGRCIERSVPGVDAVRFVYDRLGRVVMSQDGEQRRTGTWTVTKRDSLGRVAVEGRVTIPSVSHASLLALWRDSALVAVHDASLLVEDGLQYTVNGGIMSGFTADRAFYYDDYSHWTGLDPIAGMPELSVPAGTNGHGLLTGTAVTDYAGSVTVTMVARDAKGNVVVEAERDAWGQDCASATVNSYNFNNQLTGSHHVSATVYSQTAERRLEEWWDYTVNKWGRMTQARHKAGGGSWKVVAEMSYDDQGRLSQQTLGAGMYDTSYGHNLRGWLTSLGGTFTRYAESLHYNTAPPGSSAVPRWGGDVCAVEETRPGFGPSGQRWMRTFAYDELGAVTRVIDDDGTRFNEALDYDWNGNVTSIHRGSPQPQGTVQGYDDLTLAYDGNRLVSVTDNAVVDGHLGEIAQVPVGTHEVALDACGRVTADGTRGVTQVTYDPQGLPRTIRMGDDFYIYNSYRSDGVLARETERRYYLETVRRYDRVTGDSVDVQVRRSQTVVRRHIGCFDLETGCSPRSHHRWGFIDWQGDTLPRYYYYERDHQGSVRAVRDESFNVKQSVSYTLSGVPVLGVVSSIGGRHRHTGKPWHNLGGLAWYDNRARWYDPVTMRFLAPDPLADQDPENSPWAWCRNNPVNISDSSGLNWYRNSDGETIWDNGVTCAEDTPAGCTYLGERDNGLAISMYESVGQGVKIIVDYQCNEGSNRDYRWIQNVTTNSPKQGTQNQYLDPDPNDDDKPFYYTDSELENFLDNERNAISFVDFPEREQNGDFWVGELSLVKIVSGILSIQANITYGFSVEENRAVLQTIKLTKPSVFQQNTIREFNEQVK